jgi:hypothetical protein
MLAFSLISSFLAGVALVVVPALILGAVHGDVGIPHQGVSVFTIVRVHGDPNAGGDADFVTIKPEWLSKGFQDFYGNPDRVFSQSGFW